MTVRIGNADIGTGRLLVIAGPCVIESETLVMHVADRLRAIADAHGVIAVFKSSFDKANRSSGAAFRGPGLYEGLKILAKVRAETGLPVLTDVHSPEQARVAGEVVDVVQTPALLARQTDLIEAAAITGKAVNIKKGQFMAPGDMRQVVAKARNAAQRAGINDDTVMVTERGTSFGYHNLVVDMRGLAVMAETGCPVIFDATHAVQQPGALGDRSGGERQFVPLLARAAVAAGVDGVFMETHPDPENALSDAATSWPLDQLDGLIGALRALHDVRMAA